jgi:hypothetical protein
VDWIHLAEERNWCHVRVLWKAQISLLAEPFLASQEEPCPMELRSCSLSFSVVTFISAAAIFTHVAVLYTCMSCMKWKVVGINF